MRSVSSVLLLCILVQGCVSLHIYYKLAARDLPKMDDGADKTDPFAEIYLNGGRDLRIGRTDTIMDEHDPDWDNVFQVTDTPNDYLNIEVRDHDPNQPDDHIGWAYIHLKDMNVIGSKTIMLSGDGYIRGSVIVHTVGTGENDVITWQNGTQTKI